MNIKDFFPQIDKVNIIPPIVSSKLTFAELLDYKTKPCENINCLFYPRTTVANNQYLEDELKCNGYHHAKDQRRCPINDLSTFTGDFVYQANYFKEDKADTVRERYSKNFFESLYHPLYYKQFSCKREHCDKSKYCPYYHSQKERIEWEIIFERNLKLNKQAFVSSKSKKYQSMSTEALPSLSQSSYFSGEKPYEGGDLFDIGYIGPLYHSENNIITIENYQEEKLMFNTIDKSNKKEKFNRSIKREQINSPPFNPNPYSQNSASKFLMGEFNDIFLGHEQFKRNQ